MVITFSNIKGTGGGGATGGTVSGITLWSSDYTQEYIDNALSGVTDALSAYTPTSGFSTINGSAITTGDNLVIEGTPYSAGTNIDITSHIISVTGITIPTSNTAFTNDAGYITSGEAQTQIDDSISGKADTSALTAYYTSAETDTAISNAVSGKMDTSAMSAYTPTSGFSTINGSAITEGGNITVEETPYSAGTGIGISEHVISVTGDYETVVELTQAEYDALTAYSENTTYIITDAPAINMSAYTPTSGFSTINGSAITTGEAIVIEETPYSAGTNINIANHVISVTGITVPTKVSDLTNDAGYITTADTKDFVTSGDVKTQVEAYNYVNSGDVKTQIDNSISGKVDTSALTAYYTSAQTDTAISNATSGKADTSAVTADIAAATAATTGWVSEQGYLTGYTESDPIFTGSPAYGITSEDITNWNSVSGKVDTSAMTAYYTSGETNTAISNATSGLASQTWVENKGYLTSYTETDPVFMASAASGITSNDITNWNAVSGKQDTLVNQVNIKSINGTSLLGSGNIQISEGGTYTGGNNIEITAQNVINVTGITSYTGITSGDVVTALGYTPISGVDLSDYYTSAQTDTAISNATSGKADTSRVDEIEEVAASALTNLNSRVDELSGSSVTTGTVKSMITAATDGLASTTYVDNSVSGKADTSAVTADIAAATAATTGWVENQGYLTTESDPIFTGSPAYGITSEDITNWNSVSGKVDTSAMTAYATTGWVNEQGFITAFTETDPIFTGSPAYGITAQDIANWNAVTGVSTYSAGQYINIDANNEISVTGITSYTGITSGDITTALGYTPISGVDLSEYYTSSQTDTAISNAVSGKADSSRVDEIEEVTASALTDLNNRMITTGTVQSMITAATDGLASTTYVDNSVSGKLDTTAFTAYTASTQTTLNAKVGSSDSSVSDIVKMSQNDYDSLTAKSSTTLYIIV